LKNWLSEIEEKALSPVSDPAMLAAVATLPERPELNDAAAVEARIEGCDRLIVLLVRQGYSAGPDLRDTVLEQLPCDAEQAVVAIAAAIPRDASGSVDHHATAKVMHEVSESYDFTPPESAAEQNVISVLRGLLGRSTISVNDDFINLGGDSVVAAELVNILEDRFGICLDPQSVFYAETLRDMLRDAVPAQAGDAPGNGARHDGAAAR
jgi:nonribosomal peptide synthetase DhbF